MNLIEETFKEANWLTNQEYDNENLNNLYLKEDDKIYSVRFIQELQRVKLVKN